MGRERLGARERGSRSICGQAGRIASNTNARRQAHRTCVVSVQGSPHTVEPQRNETNTTPAAHRPAWFPDVSRAVRAVRPVEEVLVGSVSASWAQGAEAIEPAPDVLEPGTGRGVCRVGAQPCDEFRLLVVRQTSVATRQRPGGNSKRILGWRLG